MRRLWFTRVTYCDRWEMWVPAVTCEGALAGEECRYFKRPHFCAFSPGDKAMQQYYNKMRQLGRDSRGNSSLYE